MTKSSKSLVSAAKTHMTLDRRQLMFGAAALPTCAEARQSAARSFSLVPPAWPEILITVPPFAVASMPSRNAIRRFATAGFKILVNNSPDGDCPGQMPSAEMAKVAEQAGMTYSHIPLPDGRIDKDAFTTFMWLPQYEATVACGSDPEHAYCLWAAEQVLMSGHDPRRLMRGAERIGYKLARLPAVVGQLRAA